MLIVFRLGSFIPVPHVNTEVLKAQDQMSVFGILNTFGGGALFNFSILAMGIMPYITASIIIQLLQMDVVPKFTEWSKQGKLVAETSSVHKVLHDRSWIYPGFRYVLRV
ncbi:hypothetical protein PO124_19395 [Bacillus licheniformis]|nr:hypothetical protein [Bacillus licheniformis]